MEFEGRVALVTGGASGIGRACAFELAAAVDFLRATGARVITFRADVSEHGRASSVLDETLARLGRLDFLVNAAGVSEDGLLWKTSEAQFDRVLAVNLKGTFNYMRAAAEIFRERGAGRIVNVASIEGLRARAGVSAYAASKAGVVALTRAAAAELGRFNVTVNAVAPGFVRTPMTERLPERVTEAAVAESALGRMGEPEDVAHVVAFLCSERARHITGEVIRVDGGQLA